MVPFPFWFKQRQCKAEPVGTGTALRVTGPNLGEAFLAVEQVPSRLWRAALREKADGPEVTTTEAQFPTEREAWRAAFELYRNHVIV
jgi:hypothetical protein